MIATVIDRTAIRQRLSDPKALLVTLDANVIGGLWSGKLRGFKNLMDFCDLKNRWNAMSAEGPQLKLAVSALVHVEVLHDLRSYFGMRFNPTMIQEGMANKGLFVLSFTEGDAELLAGRLYERFPNTAEWRIGKLQRLRDEINCGLSECPMNANDPRRTSATIDWWIASHGQSMDCWILTHDKGPEFNDVPRVRFVDFESELKCLLGLESPSQP